MHSMHLEIISFSVDGVFRLGMEMELQSGELFFTSENILRVARLEVVVFQGILWQVNLDDLAEVFDCSSLEVGIPWYELSSF